MPTQTLRSSHDPRRPIRILVGLAVFCVTFAAHMIASRDIEACEEPEPVLLETDNATVDVEAFEVRPETLRQWAGWMIRVQALLPEGASVEARTYTAEVQLCLGPDDTRCRLISQRYDGSGPAPVFRILADALDIPPATRTRLSQRPAAAPLTIQLASTPLFDGAEALAERVTNEGGDVRLSQGGSALVVTDERPDDTWRFLVVTGIYLAHADAERGRAQLESLGLKGFVKRI